MICRQLDCLFSHDQLGVFYVTREVEPGVELSILDKEESGKWILGVNGKEIELPAELATSNRSLLSVDHPRKGSKGGIRKKGLQIMELKRRIIIFFI